MIRHRKLALNIIELRHQTEHYHIQPGFEPFLAHPDTG
jgi:hypothetical protein